MPTGRELILSMSARPIYGDGGKLVGAVQISLDITERKRAESQRKLLTKELDHRVKNNLAIVQALVQQTLRNATDLDEARQVVLDRLSALAKAHDLLARNAWLEGDLRATIAAAVQLQTADSRVALDGPDVSLSPGQVMAVVARHARTDDQCDQVRCAVERRGPHRGVVAGHGRDRPANWCCAGRRSAARPSRTRAGGASARACWSR